MKRIGILVESFRTIFSVEHAPIVAQAETSIFGSGIAWTLMGKVASDHIGPPKWLFLCFISRKGGGFYLYFWPCVKHVFYIFGSSSLNFGLFEIWKKTGASFFIKAQNWVLGFWKKNIFDILNREKCRARRIFKKKLVMNVWLITDLPEGLGGTLKRPNHRFLIAIHRTYS